MIPPASRAVPLGRGAFGFDIVTELPNSPTGLGIGGRRHGRTGVIHTPHGEIRTPAFVPVATQATMKAVLPEQIKDLGAQCMLSNAFHLFERPGEDLVDAAGGLGMAGVYNVTTLEYDKRVRRGEGGLRAFVAALFAFGYLFGWSIGHFVKGWW